MADSYLNLDAFSLPVAMSRSVCWRDMLFGDLFDCLPSVYFVVRTYADRDDCVFLHHELKAYPIAQVDRNAAQPFQLSG